MCQVRLLTSIWFLAFVLAPCGTAQALPDSPSMRIEAGITRSISDHVHVIPANGRPGVPNVGIVIGSRAVLVIESGLGKAGGEIILAETRRLAGDRRIYVVATHFHPEHISGEQAFPPSAVILHSSIQQGEIAASGMGLIDSFSRMSTENQLLLRDFAFRSADVIFTGTTTIDLGGVEAELISAGPAHTDGDLAVWVKQDGVLFTGDVVQENYAPMLGGHATPASWLAQIDKLETLPVRIIVPSHTAVTDRRAFTAEREAVSFLRDRWTAIKAMGLDAGAAADRLVADFQARYPTCTNAALVRFSIPNL